MSLACTIDALLKVYYTTKGRIMKNNLQKSCEVENLSIFYRSKKTLLKPIELFNEAEQC